MTDRYALADLTHRRWDEDVALEGDPESVSDPVGMLTRVRYAWSSFVSMFLISGDEARAGQIRRAPWSSARRWLTSIEDMARGLLLMMALALPVAAQPASARKPAPRPPRERAAVPATYLSVVAWLVRSPDGQSAGEGAGDAADAPGGRLEDRWHGIRGLAVRTEAVLRILNNPEPFARRVARRLGELNRPLGFPQYPEPQTPPDESRKGVAEPTRPDTPYRFLLAPLWAHCASLAAARERSG